MTCQYKIHYVTGPAGSTTSKTFTCSPFELSDRRTAYLSACRLADVVRANGGWDIDVVMYEFPLGDPSPIGLESF